MTLSNFILEQEISDAVVSDITLEQYVAEMDVAFAIASCVTKSAMITEYSSTDISEFGIFQESVYQEGEKWDKVKEIAKKWIDKLLSAIDQAVIFFLDIFTKVDWSHLQTMAINLDHDFPNLEIDWPANLNSKLWNLVCHTENFVKLLKSGSTNREDFEKVNRTWHLADQINKANEPNNYFGFEKTKIHDVAKDIGELNGKQYIDVVKKLKSTKTLLADIKDKADQYPQETMNLIQNTAKYLVGNYSLLSKDMYRCVNSIMKKARKEGNAAYADTMRRARNAKKEYKNRQKNEDDE